MLIYNLFPLLAGTFSKWNDHFIRAKEMGFDWLFINPIQKPGKSGSLYSVSDYFSINPLFVEKSTAVDSEQQVRDVVTQANNCGLQVMIDLVINHCAIDSKTVTEHPDWFIRDKQGRVQNPFCYENDKKVEWTDLAQFDYSTTNYDGLLDHFVKIIDHLVSLGFKGFRCDAAYKIPVTFWQRLIKITREHNQGIVFAAETLGCTADQTRETAGAGFDYFFNSSKWWDFQSNWLLAQYNLTRDICLSISFPESHDTRRLCEELNGNVNGLKQRYLFAALFSAGVLMPVGYEFGFRKQLNVVNTTPSDWEQQTGIDLQYFIKQVNSIKNQYMIFQENSPTVFLSNRNPNILLMWKASIASAEESLLILNTDISNRQIFYANDLRDYIQSGSPLMDISPEGKMDYISHPFHYELGPGQGIVLITTR